MCISEKSKFNAQQSRIETEKKNCIEYSSAVPIVGEDEPVGIKMSNETFIHETEPI